MKILALALLPSYMLLVVIGWCLGMGKGDAAPFLVGASACLLCVAVLVGGQIRDLWKRDQI